MKFLGWLKDMFAGGDWEEEDEEWEEDIEGDWEEGEEYWPEERECS